MAAQRYADNAQLTTNNAHFLWLTKGKKREPTGAHYRNGAHEAPVTRLTALCIVLTKAVRL